MAAGDGVGAADPTVRGRCVRLTDASVTQSVLATRWSMQSGDAHCLEPCSRSTRPYRARWAPRRQAECRSVKSWLTRCASSADGQRWCGGRASDAARGPCVRMGHVQASPSKSKPHQVRAASRVCCLCCCLLRVACCLLPVACCMRFGVLPHRSGKEVDRVSRYLGVCVSVWLCGCVTHP